MHLITRNTDYAVRALCFLAKHRNETICAVSLFKELKIPKPFLRRILQVLSKKGLLISYKGQGGGFRLSRKPERISLIELIEIFQGEFDLSSCFFKKEICRRREICALKKKIDSINRQVAEALKEITVASLSDSF